MAATIAPGFRAVTSSGGGLRTLRRISAPARASLAFPAMVAPAASRASSAKRERAPAPASTLTRQPSAVSFLTVSGDTATRGSPSRSAVTAIVTICGSLRAAKSRYRMVQRGLRHQRQQEQQDRHDQDDHDDCRPQKARVGADVLGIVHGG